MCVWQNHESSSGTCAPDRQCFDVDIFSEEDPWFLEVHRNTLLLADIEKKPRQRLQLAMRCLRDKDQFQDVVFTDETKIQIEVHTRVLFCYVRTKRRELKKSLA